MGRQRGDRQQNSEQRRRAHGRSGTGGPASARESVRLEPVQLLFATGNLGKLRELADMAGPSVSVISAADLKTKGLAALPEVVEDADSFVGNALLKAASGFRHSGMSTVADDSGLCVDALDGAPGVLSARFSGPEATDLTNLTLLLDKLDGIDEPSRGAAFACALVIAGPLAEGPGCGRTADGVAWRAFTGTTQGRITTEAAGDAGFGYDPVFFSPALKKTFGEALATEKHAVSHRGRAFGALARYLKACAVGKARGGRPLFVRPIGIDALTAAVQDVLSRGLRYADKSLERALKERPQLGSKERAAIAQLFWLALRRLDKLQLAAAAIVGPERAGTDGTFPCDPRALGPSCAGLVAALIMASVDAQGTPQSSSGARSPSALHALLSRHTELVKRLAAAPAVLAKALRKADSKIRHAGASGGYHPEFMAACTTQLGGEHAALAMAYLDGRGPLSLRCIKGEKTRHATVRDLAKAGIESVRAGNEDGVLCLRSARVTSLDGYRKGQFEIQDLGSQAIAAALAAQPGEKIADWCAGAGGKALAIADVMQGKGELYALDIHAGRLQECRRRLKRSDNEWVSVIRHSRGDGPDTRLPPLDACLVDAPCSSTGALRRNPELRWHLDTEWLGRFADQQLAILAHAASHVRDGGRLVYATCSILRAENEDVVARFVAKHPRWSLRTSSRVGAADLTYLRRHPLAEIGPDGFYYAVLQASGGDKQ
jgi:16S rRNA (cytosine967-C5)-methyltransferase